MFLSLALQMAIAAVAHMFVFSAKPYHYLPPSEHGKVVAEKTEEIVTVEEGFKEKPAVLENSEMQIQGPGTSITKSVQDIVVEGGQHVSSVSCTCVVNVLQHFSFQDYTRVDTS